MKYPEEIYQMEEMHQILSTMKSQLVKMSYYCDTHSSNMKDASEFPYIAKEMKELHTILDKGYYIILEMINSVEYSAKSVKSEFERECELIKKYLDLDTKADE